MAASGGSRYRVIPTGHRAAGRRFSQCLKAGGRHPGLASPNGLLIPMNFACEHCLQFRSSATKFQLLVIGIYYTRTARSPQIPDTGALGPQLRRAGAFGTTLTTTIKTTNAKRLSSRSG